MSDAQKGLERCSKYELFYGGFFTCEIASLRIFRVARDSFSIVCSSASYFYEKRPKHSGGALNLHRYGSQASS
jgi:hypothetical protein